MENQPTFTFKGTDCIEYSLKYHDLVCVTVDDTLLTFHLIDGKCLHRTQTLKSFLEICPEGYLLRVHKSAAINPDILKSHLQKRNLKTLTLTIKIGKRDAFELSYNRKSRKLMKSILKARSVG